MDSNPFIGDHDPEDFITTSSHLRTLNVATNNPSESVSKLHDSGESMGFEVGRAIETDAIEPFATLLQSAAASGPRRIENGFGFQQQLNDE